MPAWASVSTWYSNMHSSCTFTVTMQVVSKVCICGMHPLASNASPCNDSTQYGHKCDGYFCGHLGEIIENFQDHGHASCIACCYAMGRFSMYGRGSPLNLALQQESGTRESN